MTHPGLDHVNAVFPVNKLVPELVSAILLCGLPHLNRFSESAWQAQVQYLVSVSAVCAGWRRLALDTAQLWANVVFISRFSDTAKMELALIFLERSKGTLLDITLDLRYTIKDAYLDELRTIKQHLPRTRALYLYLPPSDPNAFLPLPSNVPHLSILDIETNTLNGVTMFESAPNCHLTSFAVWGWMPHDFALYQMNLLSLQHISWQCFDYITPPLSCHSNRISNYSGVAA